MAVNLHEEVRSNAIKSYFVIGMFIFFVAFLGAVAGIIMSGYYTGELFNLTSIITGIILALVAAGIYIAIFFAMGDRMILKATGAVEASRKNHPHLYHTTEALAIAAGLGSTVPKCYVIDDPALNAYATGMTPKKSYIVVTTGLMNKLNRQEMEGVLAHEMSHIQNRDIKVMLLAAGLVGAIVLIADILFRMFIFAPRGGGEKRDGKVMLIVIVVWLLLIILSPIIGEMIRLAISRRREYLADASAGILTRYPEGLASALEKIQADPNELKAANKATAHLFISSPFKKKRNLMVRLFSTHPPIEERIKRLRGQRV